MLKPNKQGFLLALVLSSIPALGIMLAGCAGGPPEEELADTEPSLIPSAEEVILDARLLAQNSDFETAASKLEELLQKESDNIEALRLLAGIYTAMGDKGNAVSTWIKISNLDPTDADAAYEAGTAMARKKDWGNVRSRMLAAESAGIADSRHYLLIGEAAIELGYIKEAERYLKRAAGLERALYLMGKLYYEQGKLEEAESYFMKAVKSNPDNQPAHLHLGWISYSRDKKRQALEHYKKATDLRPDDPLARLSLAALLEEMKDPVEAIAQYKEALSLAGIPRGEKKKVYNSLSRLLVERGLCKEAVATIKKGLTEFPEAGGLYYQWGEALLTEGRMEEAQEKFKRAAEDPAWRKVALQRWHTIRLKK